ncbi:2Fe-2S iron-sulfur cluster-binding protein [Streptomyces klenkii]|uniref:2Fe-2S iron-sulfur cluster-binding protein n=1 Tax=Streptomyces klenkii TaxID=1420899 RepID=UPI0036EC7DF0
MSDEQRQAHAAGPAGWQPIPRGGEYDEGTTFLQLPPELLAHPGAAMSGTGAWDPLAAAGSGGYVPPSADSWQQAPAAAGAHGQWGVPQASAAPQPEAHGADPQATAEWPMPGDGSVGASGSTGQWSVPAAGDDPVDESGEYVVQGGAAAQDPAGAAPAPAPAPWSAQPVDDSWRQSLAAATPAAGTPIAGDTGQWSVPVVSEGAVDASDASGEYALGGFTSPVGPVASAASDASAASGASVAGHSASAEPPAVDVTGAFTVPQYVTDVTGTGDNPGGVETVAAAEEPERAVLPAQSAQLAQPEGSVGEPEQQPEPQQSDHQQHAQSVPPQQPMHAESFGHAEQAERTGGNGLGEQPGLPTLSQEPEQPGEQSAERPAQPEQHAQPTQAEPFVPQQSGPEAADAAAAAVAAGDSVADAVADSVAGSVAPAAAGGPVHEDPAPTAYAPLGHDPLGADPLGADPLGIGAPHTEHPCASYVLRVNGTDRPVTDAWIGESLLYVLRERLGLAGAKDGCSQGECGACSVQVDGRLVASCLVPAATTAGSEVRTVEGLAVGGRPSDVQRALAECGAVQCGFCVPGMAMTMHDLLEGNHAPTELETRQAICGNLCRCSGYRGVLDAVRQVVGEREAAAAHEQELQQGTQPEFQPEFQPGLQDAQQQYEQQQYEQYEAGQPDADQARIPHQAGPHGGGSGRATA